VATTTCSKYDLTPQRLLGHRGSTRQLLRIDTRWKRPVPATGSRIEVRDENFNLLSVHWSAAAALGETGERLARGEKAAVYLARWDRIEAETDPLLKETS